LPEEEPEELEEVVEEKPVVAARRRAVANETPPDDDEPEMLEEVSEKEVPEADRSPMDQPRKKKKKKRRRQLLAEREEEREAPAWPWWVFGVGSVGLVELALLVVFLIADDILVKFCTMYLFIMFPISTVIFFAAMLLSNVTVGAGEIGEIHVTLVKCFIMVAIANVVSLFPFGGYATLIIYVVGLISLFRMDFWEARMIIFFNWLLNFGARWIIIMVVTGILAAGAREKDNGKNFDPPQRGKAGQQNVPPPDDDDP
jgi:hypothetical protein